MNLHVHLTLRRKIRLMLMAVSTGVVTLACAAFVTFSVVASRRAAVRDLLSLAEVVANNCQFCLYFRNTEDAAQILSGLDNRESVVHVAIYDDHNRLFYPPSALDTSGHCRRTLSDIGPRGYRFEDGGLHLHRDIIHQGLRIGTLHLVDDLRDNRLALRQSLLATGGVLVLALVVAYLLSRTVEPLVSRRILHLADVARAVSEDGDYAVRAVARGHDEVATLTRAFNQMLAGIAQRDAALRDEVTERRRAEERLRQFNATLEERVVERTRDLERSNRDLEQFAYVASHDLQEPLRTVGSYVQLLKKRYGGQLDADADEFIEYAVEAVDRMQRLIRDLLAYSRVGTRGSPFRPTDCGVVLQAARDNLQAALTEAGAVLTSDPLPTLWADTNQLVQVFQNLIGNAVKFRRADEAPHVHVSAQRTPDCTVPAGGHAQSGGDDDDPALPRRAVPGWLFSVRDNGIGFDQRYADRAFVIFQRLHSRRQYSGTGIGLAFCKRIVERHGGRIWGESTVGQGSTFYFTIPDKENAHEDT